MSTPQATVTVACCQAPLAFGDRGTNLAALRRAVDEAVAAGARGRARVTGRPHAVLWVDGPPGGPADSLACWS